MGRWCWKRIFAIFLSVAVLKLLMSAAGCGRLGMGKAALTYNLGEEPVTLDPALCTEIREANVILATFEGLMKLDKDNRAIPGAAQSYSRKSETKYIFTLRDSKWWDGKALTAMDFEYGWKRVLAPETMAPYAYQLYCIKNGEAYNKGRASAASVGVKAIDEKTLEVTLEYPVPYFLELLALPQFMPLRQDVVDANPGKWAKSPDTYIGNGPFKMAAYRPGDVIELEKNMEYYDSSRISLDRLYFKMIEDPNEYLSALREGSLDVIEAPPSQEVSALMADHNVKVNPFLGSYFYAFNCKVKPLNDRRVRLALSYAIDRQMIVSMAAKSLATPASSLVPGGMADADISRDFRDVGGSYFKAEAQAAEGKSLLAEAGYPDGRGFPTLKILCDDSGYHQKIAEAIKAMWRDNLGINVDIEIMDSRQLNEARKNGQYEIARQGWIADYPDPMAFLEIFLSGAANNIAGYSNSGYDKTLMRAKEEDDVQERINLLHEAENIIMNDMPVMPIFFYTDILVSKPYVKGVVKTPLGFTYFDQAYVEGK